MLYMLNYGFRLKFAKGPCLSWATLIVLASASSLWGQTFFHSRGEVSPKRFSLEWLKQRSRELSSNARMRDSIQYVEIGVANEQWKGYSGKPIVDSNFNWWRRILSLRFDGSISGFNNFGEIIVVKNKPVVRAWVGGKFYRIESEGFDPLSLKVGKVDCEILHLMSSHMTKNAKMCLGSREFCGDQVDIALKCPAGYIVGDREEVRQAIAAWKPKGLSARVWVRSDAWFYDMDMFPMIFRMPPPPAADLGEVLKRKSMPWSEVVLVD